VATIITVVDLVGWTGQGAQDARPSLRVTAVRSASAVFRIAALVIPSFLIKTPAPGPMYESWLVP
jgi:hypothetical protein